MPALLNYAILAPGRLAPSGIVRAGFFRKTVAFFTERALRSG
jgi:hypothetical protein